MSSRPWPPRTGRLNRTVEHRAEVARVPPVVSGIVMRPLAKSPEDRYQSAHDMAADLRACLARWEATGAIEDGRLSLIHVAQIMGTSVRQLEDTYFRWLSRTSWRSLPRGTAW